MKKKMIDLNNKKTSLNLKIKIIIKKITKGN